MPELTREEAIDYNIELWTFCAETGKGKHEWKGWETHGHILNRCFLCEYTKGDDTGLPRCNLCPYYQKYGGCIDKSTPYYRWERARTGEARMKYAHQFLKQLKTLKQQ